MKYDNYKTVNLLNQIFQKTNTNYARTKCIQCVRQTRPMDFNRGQNVY